MTDAKGETRTAKEWGTSTDHAKMLEDAAVGDDVTLRWVTGADHSEIPVVAGDDYETLLRDFVTAHLPAP